MPSRSTLLIAVLWLLTLGGAISSVSSAPHSDFPREMPTATTVTILLLPILFFSAGSFWMQHSPFYSPRVARFIDARFGANAFSTFLVRLRPLLMFSAGAGIQGILGLWQAARLGEGSGAYTIHGFFISGGIGFALAHAILYCRKVLGVYPARESIPSIPQRGQPLPLREALRKYWWTMLGLAAFPTVTAVLVEIYRVQFEYFMLPFFAAGMLASWPVASGRAPFSFCIVLGIVWIAAAIVAMMLVQLAQRLVAGG